ncbi:hypothetical protein ACH5RR_005147 [Cinchona calisaya]|uniref:Sel1-like protein n=1 Tax=Cinchona calisaya TaxID=153742 RepID=A0ABD3AKF2_9GENT
MGKTKPTAAQPLAQRTLALAPNRIKTTKPTPKSPQNHLNFPQLVKKSMEEEESNGEKATTVPLSEVVSECVKRWFSDTLKEAKAGDVNMQVLVAQMYFNGYGVSRDAQKGRIWMTRASRVRSSVWKVSNKRPGYNASDSDSDEWIGES